jgi:hypothetical protein
MELHEMFFSNQRKQNGEKKNQRTIATDNK